MNAQERPCQRCHGTGEVQPEPKQAEAGLMAQLELQDCPSCHGTGER